MKIVSWNVNGLRACYTKGLGDYFSAADADIFCIQETKMQQADFDFSPDGYYGYWNDAQKKGYSGTAVFSRIKPKDVTYGIGIYQHDHEGRVITLDMGAFFLVNVYVPNAQQELKRLPYRMMWDDDFRSYLEKLDGQKSLIVCGDFNVAHKEIDLKNPASNRRSAGFTDEERDGFSRFLDAGFTDTFRHLYPNANDAYTYWSYRFGARARNAGWRIDYVCMSNRIVGKLKNAAIHSTVMGSDHCPISAVLQD